MLLRKIFPMDFNLNFTVVEQSELEEREACEMLSNFLNDNHDLDGIYRIQIEEVLSFLRRKSSMAGEM